MKINAEAQLVLVDSSDNEVGVVSKLQAHRLGLLHRAFSVFVFRQLGGEYELLLQQRQVSKYHSPGLWSNTCCSHPAPGENVMQAARRRLQFEMGFDADLFAVGSFIYRADVGCGLIENEYDYVFVGKSVVEIPEFNKDEVMSVKWMPVSALKLDLINSPQNYTAWKLSALNLILQNHDVLDSIFISA